MRGVDNKLISSPISIDFNGNPEKLLRLLKNPCMDNLFCINGPVVQNPWCELFVFPCDTCKSFDIM